MFGFLGKVLGTDKALSKTIEVVSNGLDSLVYTDQEKAEDGKKERTEVRGMVVEWMRSTQGQNLARRIIALLIVVGWLSMYFGAMGLAVASVWVVAPERYQSSAEIVGNFAQGMNDAVMLILAFYFAAPHMGQIVGPALAAFGKVPPPSKTKSLTHE